MARKYAHVIRCLNVHHKHRSSPAQDTRMTAMHQLLLATRAEASDIRGPILAHDPSVRDACSGWSAGGLVIAYRWTDAGNTDTTKGALDKLDDKWQAPDSAPEAGKQPTPEERQRIR